MSRKQRQKRARARARAVPSSPPGERPDSPAGAPAPSSGGAVNRFGLVAAVVALAGLFALVVILGEGPPLPAEPEPSSEEEESAEEPERSPVETWQAGLVREIPVSDRDFVRGPGDARVTIVEFGDFECPFCKVATAQLGELLERYPSEVRLVYKNFPLDISCNGDMTQQLHPFACKAAVMARCAGREDPDRFWQFHDAVFTIEDFSDESLDRVASELGMDGDGFSQCVKGREAFDEVRADIELASALGVSATPTVYVNGRMSPSYEADALSEIIEHILETR